MINRKLLKANRWFDEKFLEARMTNACFGGGGDGGDAGQDDPDEDQSFSMGGYSDAVSAGMAQVEAQEAQAGRDAMAADIDRQMEQDARNREMAAIDAQMAQDERNRTMAAIDAQMAQDERNRTMAAIDAQMAQQDRERQMTSIDAIMGQQDRERQMASIDATMAQDERNRTMASIDATMGQQDRSRQMAEIDAMMAGDQTRRDIAADDYMGAGGFLDPTRSPAQSSGAYVDKLGSEQGLYDATTANINTFGEQFGPNHAFNRLTREEQMRAMDRFNAGPSGIANMFNLSDASRMANLANSVMDNRVGPTHPDWGRGDPARDVRPVDQTDDFIGSTIIPPGPGGGGGFPPGGGGWPPGGGGGWPPGGGGGYPPWYPPGGGGGMWPPGGGGGYPGGGGRTGGGMPGYMPNYPIHSQNLFNFTPARAMPGVDPSYQPWMQPAQGMAENLWNYQAPNLVPWDMTNRVPWNFADTPTGQYGPMVATSGGEPAIRGDR